jgi:hypothetical protein
MAVLPIWQSCENGAATGGGAGGVAAWP